jgi:uncharacterized protein (DUF2147 family)
MNPTYKYLTLIALLIGTFQTSIAQLTGRWKTIGDQDGTEKAVVEIYERDGLLYGKVEKLLPAAKHTHCENCPGELKNKPIEGMVIMRNMKKTSMGGTDGKILDPSSGKTFNVSMELQETNKLKVRGYLGVPTIGKTQYWYRVK